MALLLGEALEASASGSIVAASPPLSRTWVLGSNMATTGPGQGRIGKHRAKVRQLVRNVLCYNIIVVTIRRLK